MTFILWQYEHLLLSLLSWSWCDSAVVLAIRLMVRIALTPYASVVHQTDPAELVATHLTYVPVSTAFKHKDRLLSNNLQVI